MRPPQEWAENLGEQDGQPAVREAGEPGGQSVLEARPGQSPGPLINFSEQAPIIFYVEKKARPEMENFENEPVS